MNSDYDTHEKSLFYLDFSTHHPVAANCSRCGDGNAGNQIHSSKSSPISPSFPAMPLDPRDSKAFGLAEGRTHAAMGFDNPLCARNDTFGDSTGFCGGDGGVHIAKPPFVRRRGLSGFPSARGGALAGSGGFAGRYRAKASSNWSRM